MAAAIEVTGGNMDGLIFSRLKKGVKTRVANDIVRAACMPKITADDGGPPAGLPGEPGCCCDVYEFPVLILKKGDGRPFADDDEIGGAVAVEIGEDCVGDHAKVVEIGSYVCRDISEFYAAVLRIVSIDEAVHRAGVMPGIYPAGNEEVHFSIVVVVEGADAEFAGMVLREGQRIAGKMSFAVV